MSATNYDVRIILGIIVVSIFIISFFFKFAKNWQESLLVLFLLGGTTVYSGIGIAQDVVDKTYIPIFFIFMIFEGIGLFLGFKVFKPKGEPTDIFTPLARSNKIMNAAAILYWAIIVFLLVYPTNHLFDFFTFSIKTDISGVFETRAAKRTNSIVYVLGLFSTILSVFYYMFLASKTKKIIIPLLLLEDYCFTVTNGYIGRTELMMLLIRITLVLIIFDPIRYNVNHSVKKELDDRNDHNEKASNTDRNKLRRLLFLFLFLLVGFFLFVPFLVSYQFTRKGGEYTETGYLAYLQFIFENEVFYPIFYENTESLKGIIITPLQYLYWFLTLPFPKELVSLPKSIAINNIVSEELTGVLMGESNYVILLISLLGEGILLWGKYLCFIHGLFVGFVWGSIGSYISRYKELVIFQIFFITKTFNMIRGGSQGSISFMVNCFIPFFVISFVLYNLFYKKRLVLNSKPETIQE